MRINQDQGRTKCVRPKITHEQMREECRFWIGRMFLPIEPHQRSVIALINKVVHRTGLGARRVEKLWRGYVAKPNALEYATLAAAYGQWLEDWKAQGFRALEENEAEHAANLRTAADYESSRWKRAGQAGSAGSAVGPEATDGAGR